MGTETRSEARPFTPFAPFLGGPGAEQAKAWEESLTGFYQGLFDTWATSAKPFGSPQPGSLAGPEDLMKWYGMFWKESFSSMATVQDRMEAFAKFAKIQQQGGQDVYQAFVDCVRRVSAAQQDGGLEKAIQVCMEAHGGLVDTMEHSFLDQARAFFDCCRAFVPRESRTAKTRKEKAS